ncbi:response regulator [Porphyrobacter sp. YT40]|uniref:response regulator transcription factor n=1 Tax=Porphyrobacter sp. YT40 TaxID=2547601 RepID=UPI001144E8A1|nr:response regulator [Porphyrobacter sp. YT40]QDH33916.1 response regulator transcription factor [Porphyrobacter sp. YT40]
MQATRLKASEQTLERIPMSKTESEAPLIAIVDDQRDVRTTVSRGLEQHGYRVHPFVGGADLLEALEYLEPDCILLDVRMPGLDGLSTLARIPPARRHVPVIFFTSHGDVPLAVEAIKNGAADFIEKPSTFETIVRKIKAAMLASRPSVEKSRFAAQARELLADLTQRENQVIRLACTGKRNKEIAEELNIGVRTVEFHRFQAIHKLGESNLLKVARIFEAAERE